ncbi:MAG: RNA-binding protein [Methanobacteriota archaeon]|nr:MAG: RNA-binding protein [Euryarchaeota archaeon]
MLRQAKDKATAVTVRVGKDGITDSVIQELISNRGLVKTKANRGVANSSAERSEMFRLLAESTGSTVVHIRGNVAVFWSGKN